MKRILITGANSYVGTSVEKYLSQWDDQYQIDTIDMIGEEWNAHSFSGYDTVFHVAGIAHNDRGRLSDDKKALYYAVNTDLSLETAKKAKENGVRQFIYMSSVSVYGNNAPLGTPRVITKETPPSPSNTYGDSKLQAEKYISTLENECFRVCILRPPMVYGKGCRGNYQTLRKLALISPVFPNIENRRSMIYIDNLSEFVKRCIDEELSGMRFPHNAVPVCTKDMVIQIAQNHGKKICMLNHFAFLRKLKIKILQKVFGDLYYNFDGDSVDLFDFDQSIALTETD